MMAKIKAEEIEKIQTLPKSFQREEMLEMFWMNRFQQTTPGFEPRERECSERFNDETIRPH